MTQTQPPQPLKDVLTSEELYDATIEDYKFRKANPGAMGDISLPIPWLTKRVRWRKGWMHLIGGKAGIGKSTMGTMVGVAIAKAGMSALYITLEDGAIPTAHRVISNIKEVSRVGLRDANLDAAGEAKLFSASGEFKKYKITWATAAYEEPQIIALIQKYKPEWLIIDYLQQLVYKGMDLRERVDAACEFGRKVANGFYTPGHLIGFVATLQLNDQNESYGSRSPNRHADLYMKISDKDDGAGGKLPDKRDILIEKFRWGSGGDRTTLTLRGDFNRYEEPFQMNTGLPQPNP